MRQVAAGDGVEPALVRRFFGGKEELFTEVASALIDPDSAMADGPVDQARSASCGISWACSATCGGLARCSGWSAPR
jgi:AcrR family transcriptional regulator